MMEALAVQFTQTVPGALAILSLAVTLGLFFGAIRFRGMRLGISGVLFAALAFGQCGLLVELSSLKLLREFSLIIFIYALGLQVGPGFLASLRAEGLRLNALSVSVLVLGALMVAAIVRFARLPDGSSPGIYAGAFTTTPALAAGQDALRSRLMGPATLSSNAEHWAGLAYSVSYPFGVVGPILVIAGLRKLFGVNLDAERKDLAAAEETRRPPISAMDFEVTEAAHAGRELRGHPLVRAHGVVFSRLLRDGVVTVPTADTVVQVGDIYRAVGNRRDLGQLIAAMGRSVSADLGPEHTDIERKEIVVTRTQVLRRTIRELDLIRRHGVTIARIHRAGIELVPKPNLRLAFADRVAVVGPVESIRQIEAEFGNSLESLNRPQLVPIFLGIVLGVLVGSLKLPVPFTHTSLRIGMAGGPLLVAILLSQLGNVGSVVWYMPSSANALFRDFGLAVFLACVGLEAGDHLFQRVIFQGGLKFAFWGALVTMIPVGLVGIVARKVFGMNFITLSGWVAGAMTSSPALAFASDITESDAPAVAYAAVAPLGLLVPILCAQMLGGV